MVSIQSIFLHFSHSYPSIIKLIFAFCYVLGMGMTVAALYKLKVYGELRTMMATQTSLKEPIAALIAATVFLYIPSALKTMMNTTFGYTDITPLSYISSELSDYKQTVQAVLGWVQIIGLISFIRGWHFITQAAQHGRAAMGGGMGKGLTHIFGGLLAMNIAGTKEIIWNTFGFN